MYEVKFLDWATVILKTQADQKLLNYLNYFCPLEAEKQNKLTDMAALWPVIANG